MERLRTPPRRELSLVPQRQSSRARQDELPPAEQESNFADSEFNRCQLEVSSHASAHDLAHASASVSSVEERLFRATASCSFPAAAAAAATVAAAPIPPRARLPRKYAPTSATTGDQRDGAKRLRTPQESHDFLTSSSWTRLLFIVLSGYCAAGALAALALHATSRHDVADWHGDVPEWARWWSNGLFLLLAQPNFEPESLGQAILMMFFALTGVIVLMMLFGLIHVKLAAKPQLLAFADTLMLRKLPAEMGGCTMLIFRYAHLSGADLHTATVRCSMLSRGVTMPGGDTLEFIEPLTLRSFESTAATVPRACFFYHVIDSHSPLYDASRPPARCSFEGCNRIFLSLFGYDRAQMLHCGGAEWGVADIVPDARFTPTSTSVSASASASASASTSDYCARTDAVGESAVGKRDSKPRRGDGFDLRAFHSYQLLEEPGAQLGASREGLGLLPECVRISRKTQTETRRTERETLGSSS